MYFVVQKKHASGNDTWTNNVHTKASEDDAMHQFHAFMSTYAYGQDNTLDYVACSVEADDGRVIKNEIDDKRAAPEEA